MKLALFSPREQSSSSLSSMTPSQCSSTLLKMRIVKTSCSNCRFTNCQEEPCLDGKTIQDNQFREGLIVRNCLQNRNWGYYSWGKGRVLEPSNAKNKVKVTSISAGERASKFCGEHVIKKACDMEGVGEEVYIFGLVTFIAGYLLYKTLVYLVGELRADATGQSDETDISRRGRTRSAVHQCSICLEDARLAVETNCGHVFCSNCLLEVWRQSSQLAASPCPYCRQRVTLMLPYFTMEENNAAEPSHADERRRLVGEMATYNRLYSGEPRSVVEQLRDLPMLLRHLLTRLVSGEGLHLAFQVRIVVLSAMWLLYLLSPLDLIPEALFGLVGLLDDLLIFLFIAAHLAFVFRTLMTANLGDRGIQQN